MDESGRPQAELQANGIDVKVNTIMFPQMGGAYTAVRVPKPSIYTRGGQATFAGEAGLYLEL